MKLLSSFGAHYCPLGNICNFTLFDQSSVDIIVISM